MKNSHLLTTLILATMLYTSCSRQRPDTIKLRIIQTSDVHGALFPKDYLNQTTGISSMANVTSFVKTQRSQRNQEVILLDNGDMIQGDPSVYYSNFIDTSNLHICSQIYNYLQYDVVCIGNHDIEPGHSVYDKLVDEMDMPMLGANVIDNESGEPYFQPYQVIDREGVKIVVLGITTPAIPTWLPEKIWSGMHFEDMVLTAQKWVSIIKEEENPDVLIGLFHSGLDYQYNGQNENTLNNENASQLIAEKVPGFDLILTGHDHHGWNKTILNNENKEVLIMGPTSRARDVSVVDIEMFYKAATDTYEKQISGMLVGLSDQEPDKEYMDKFGYFSEETDKYVTKPVGRFTQTLDSRKALLGPAAFTDLIHQVQLELTDADISLTAPLSFNAVIDTGNIFVKDLFKLYRFENLLYTMKLTGKEVKDMLEYSYGLWFGVMYSTEDHLINYKRDEFGRIKLSDMNNRPITAGQYFNYESAAGINYTVDISQPSGNRVSISGMSNGEPFDESKIYIVAMNSYRGNGGGGHLTKGAGIPSSELPARLHSTTEKDMRYYLQIWIHENTPVNIKAFHNWKVIPENFAEAGRKNDIQLLFGNNF